MALADIGKYYPGATKYEVSGFFFWQGERDLGAPPVHAEHYEKNLVQFIKSVRKDFNAPNARFVLATLGEAKSWLISMSSNFDNHAIHRGRWIRERLLGGRILEVPITVNAMLPDEPHRGLRDRMRVTREEYCWKCHKTMDPLGFPFEQYDHFGRFRTVEIVVDKLKNKATTGRRTMTSIPSTRPGPSPTAAIRSWTAM